jgi:hypothetical protein
VVRIARDDGADDRDGVDLLPPGQSIRGQRAVVHAGHAHGFADLDAPIRGGVRRRLRHPLGDGGVELRDHESEIHHTRSSAPAKKELPKRAVATAGARGRTVRRNTQRAAQRELSGVVRASCRCR